MAFIPDEIPQNKGFIPDVPVPEVSDIDASGFIPDPIRFGKQLTNIFSKSLKEGAFNVGGGRIASYIAASKLNKVMKEQGIDAPSLRDTQKRVKQAIMGEYERGIPEFEVGPAKTIGEKVTDVAAGITGFVTKLAILKKTFPKAGGASLWEMENLSSGGTPGLGAAAYGVFNLPSKLIKGASLAARGGKLAAESAMLGGMTAVHQKLDSGEIDWKEVAISAGIPVAMRSLGGVKKLLKKNDPRITKAIAKIHPEILERLPEPREYIGKKPRIRISGTGELRKRVKPINVYKTVSGSRKGVLETDVKRVGERYVDKITGEDVILDTTASTTGIVDTPKPIQTANEQLVDWSRKASYLRKTEVTKAIKELRKEQAISGAERFHLEKGKGKSTWEAIKASKWGYKRKANVPTIEPPKLTEAQWQNYAKKIEQMYPEANTQFKLTGTLDALDMLRRGKVPTNYQFRLLEPLLGKSTTEKIYTELIKKKPFSGWELPALTIQLFKTKFGYDIQTPRQARSLAPTHPKEYVEASWANIRGYASKEYANTATKILENSPGYDNSTKYLNYVGTTGYSAKRLEYFRMGLTERLVHAKFKRPALDKTMGRALRAKGRTLRASERGAVIGINTMMKSLWDIAEKDLAQLPNMTPAKQHTWRVNRGKTINTFMKILRTENPKAAKLQNAANYILYSPSMTVSRPLSIKALVANKGSRGYAAEVIAKNIASIFLTTSITAIIGKHLRAQKPDEEPYIDGELNPLSGSWGKNRVKDQVFDFSGGDAPFYRTLVRLGVSAYLKGQETITGKQQQTVAGKRVAPMGETLLRYGETRETAAISLAKSLLTGKDWLGNDIPGLEALVRAISPEIVEATIEAGMADGTWAALATGVMTAGSVGVADYPVKAATTRGRFRDIISDKEHNKRWDDLTLLEQRKLINKNRKKFTALDKRVKAERIEKPFSPEKIIEEEHKSGKRIVKMLSKENRAKIVGVKTGVSRRPKNWYLNDSRYQLYQELVAQHLDDRLSRISIVGKSDIARIKALEVAVKIAKLRAFRDLQKVVKR